MNNRLIAAALAGMLFAATATAQAAEAELRPYLSGLYNLTFEDDSRASKRGHGASFSVGKALNHYWGIEFGGFLADYDAENGGAGVGWNEYGFHIDGLFFYGRERSFSPYFVLGAGRATNFQKNGNESDDGNMLHAGLGFMKQMGDHLGYRADLRYRVINNTDLTAGDFSEPVLRVGLTYALGDRPKPKKARYTAAGFDSDGDGVMEDVDRCPGTPASTRVDANGCPDSDADGVGDSVDECPDTPAGARVDARGCSLDSDGDDVYDYADKCPNTGSGEGVDADGCPTNGAVIRKFEDVNFAFDKAALSDYARITLDGTAKVIREMVAEYPNLRIEVDGHTDWVGSDAYNLDLGMRRATTVKDYLTGKGGIERTRVHTRSYGESNPVATNETAKGRLLNRRAEIRARAGR